MSLFMLTSGDRIRSLRAVDEIGLRRLMDEAFEVCRRPGSRELEIILQSDHIAELSGDKLKSFTDEVVSYGEKLFVYVLVTIIRGPEQVSGLRWVWTADTQSALGLKSPEIDFKKLYPNDDDHPLAAIADLPSPSVGNRRSK